MNLIAICIKKMPPQIFITNQTLSSKTVSIRKLSAEPSKNGNQKSERGKPNLRQPGTYNRNKYTAIVACLLAAIYMYPMIFKPLFGLGSLDDDQREKTKQIRNELEKRRHSSMPEWTNPFGPKRTDR